MYEFHSVSHILAPFQGEEASHRLNGPPVSCIAWIPYYANAADLPDSGFRRYARASRKWWQPKSATDFMFLSGNPEPPKMHDSPDAFIEYLRRKEFRGVLALDGVSALLAPNGSFMGVEFESMGGAGYTPLRYQPGTPRITCAGYGDRDYRLTVVPHEYLTINIWQSFKMGLAVDLANYVLTGARATSATMHISYTFKVGGEVEIILSGSAIPTQSYMVGWADCEPFYDMIEASESEIADFFNAGRCVTAPITERKKIYESTSFY
jgi:hypothetical protein